MPTTERPVRHCWWCGIGEPGPNRFTRDHLIPQWARLILGRYRLPAPHSLLRRVVCCKNCNSTKGAMPPALFAVHRGDRKALKPLQSEWSKLSHLLGGSWNGEPREVEPVAVEELQRAMSAPFTHNGVRFPVEGDKSRVPSQGYSVGARARVILIDTSQLSKQPDESAAGGSGQS